MKRIVKWIPKVLALMILWGAVGYLVVYVEPSLVRDVIMPGLYLPFVGTIVLASWYSLLLLTKSMKVASGMAIIILIALVTMILRYMNLLIAISLLGMVGGMGLTLVKRS